MDFFARMRQRLEPAYLASDEPWRQSGFSGPEARWIALRKPIADCVDRSGTFLDIGCANGYLVECLLRWTADRHLTLDPYGIDLSPPLVALAQRRLPTLASHFLVANGFTFRPPRRFDFVRTELCYVPADAERAYLQRLLAEVVAPNGTLLVCNYAEAQPDVATRIVDGAHPTSDLLARLTDLGFPAASHRDAFDAVKGRRTRIALLRNR